MSIREEAVNLKKIYDEMSQVFSSFQSSTGLNCQSGCGRCCFFPDVEASAFEMMPFALKVYDEGKLEEWLEKVSSTDRKICFFLDGDENSGQGRCQSYTERPSICRMFGVHGHKDKNQNPRLATCKTIKEIHGEKINQVEKNLVSSDIPMLANWHSYITGLGSGVALERLPINLAIKTALEKVASAAQYQEL